jgi:hypothetical protein
VEIVSQPKGRRATQFEFLTATFLLCYLLFVMEDPFKHYYFEGCTKYGLSNKHHLAASPFLSYLEQERLDVKCDRISSLEWAPFAYALKRNTTLKKIRLYCGIIKPFRRNF